MHIFLPFMSRVLKGATLKNEVFKLVQTLFPEWANDAQDFQLSRVSGALTKYVQCLDKTLFFLCVLNFLFL